MSKYYCDECEMIFDESEAGSRRAEEGDGLPPWESLMTCPNCGSDFIEEAWECERCGDAIPPGHYYCAACSDDMHFIVDRAIKEVGGDYSKAKDVLFDYMEREWL